MVIDNIKLSDSEFKRIAIQKDYELVVHGRKIEDGDIGCFWLCSLCDECLPYGAKYCPFCGAKMDGGASNAVG